MTFGRTIEEYHIGRLLGRGSFGDVYEATCIHSSKCVAIKMISKQLLQNQGMMERVVREVEIHCQLRHPHVVELFEYFEDAIRVYFVMELCARGELLTLLREKGRVDLQSARVYFSQLVSGVEYLHSQSILHRDLKLSNLLLTRDWTLKIADFGLAAALAGGDAERRTICGTPNYMCPEIVAHEPYTLAADLWSLGVTLYTFLTGSPPFQSDAVQGTLQRVGSCDYQCPSDMPPDAAHLVSQLLQKDPKMRLPLSGIKKHPFLSGTMNLLASKSAAPDQREGPSLSPDASGLHTVNRPVPQEPHSPSARHVHPTRTSSSGQNFTKTQNAFVSRGPHVDRQGGSSDKSCGESPGLHDRSPRAMQQDEAAVSQHSQDASSRRAEVMRRSDLRESAVLGPVHGGRGGDDVMEGEDELLEGELHETSSSAGDTLGSVASLDGMLGNGPEGRTLPTKPLSTARLRPLRHEMAYGSLSILEDGQVCVEHRGIGKAEAEERGGEDGVGCCLFYVARDGVNVRVERPGRAPRRHRFPFLPEALVGHYAHAAAFVGIVAAATPKVVYVSERAQATCMENSDLQVAFVDSGPVVSVHMAACNGSTSIVAADGAVYTLPSLHSRPSDIPDSSKASSPSTAHLLPGAQDKAIWDAVSHARRCHRRCAEAEARALAQNPAKSFPLVARSRRIKSNSRPPLSDGTPAPNTAPTSYPETIPQPPLRSHPLPLSESLRSLALSSSRPLPASHIVQSIQHSVAHFANNSSGSLLSGDLSSGSSNSSSSFHVPHGGLATPAVPPHPLPHGRLKPLQSPVSPLSPNPSMQSGPSDRSMPCSPLGAGPRNSSTAGYPRGSHDSSSACAPLDAGTDHSMGSGPRRRAHHACSSSDEHNWLSANGSDASGSLTGSDVPSHPRKSWSVDRETHHSGGETEPSNGWPGDTGFQQSQGRRNSASTSRSSPHPASTRRVSTDDAHVLGPPEPCVNSGRTVQRTRSAAWDRGVALDCSGRSPHQSMPHQLRTEPPDGTGWEIRWNSQGDMKRMGEAANVRNVSASECRCRHSQSEMTEDKCWPHCVHCQVARGQHLYGRSGNCRSCGELLSEERERRGSHKACAECGSHSLCCSLRCQDRRETASWAAGPGECSNCGEKPGWGGFLPRGPADFDSRQWDRGQRHQQEKACNGTPAVCWACSGQGRYAGWSSTDAKGGNVACQHVEMERGRRSGRGGMAATLEGRDVEEQEDRRTSQVRGRPSEMEQPSSVSASPAGLMASKSQPPLASLAESPAEGVAAPDSSPVDVRNRLDSDDNRLAASGNPPAVTNSMHANSSTKQREQQLVVDPSPRILLNSSESDSRSSQEFMVEGSPDRPLTASRSSARIREGSGQLLQEESPGVASHRAPPPTAETDPPVVMKTSAARPELRNHASVSLPEGSGSGMRNSRQSGTLYGRASLRQDSLGAREATLEELRQSAIGGEALVSPLSQEGWNGRQSAYFPGVGWAIRLPTGELLMHYLDDAQMVVTADGASVEYWAPGGATTGQRYDLTVRNSIPSEVKAKLQHLAAFIRLLKKQPSPSTSQVGAEVSHEHVGK